MFESFTYERIMLRLLDRVRDDVDKREGSIIWDALAPAALELEAAYLMLEYLLNQTFADTAERDFLILRARERGLLPYAASPATLKGVFAPPELDVTGKRFSLGELNFTASARVENEPGAWELVCETPGAAGHQTLGTLIPIDRVPGLTSAAAVAVLIPGEDEEATEDFRDRYFASFGEKAFGGNIRDYVEKISAIEGVGGVRVTPVWDGPRTVKCTIVDASWNPATPALVEKVQNLIDPRQDGLGDGFAPIDHVVTIDAPATVEVNVALRPEFAEGYSWENMAERIEAMLAAYLLELRQAWKSGGSGAPTVVRLSQIETRLLDLPGVVDVTGVTINGAAANLSIGGNALPVMGVTSLADG